MSQLRVFAVWLDHVVARRAGGVRVAAERAHPERQPDRSPGQAARPGDRFDLVQLNDPRRLARHLKPMEA
jgi:hypothetical protein